MANVISVNVYQINQRPPIPAASVVAMGFPGSGCLLIDTSLSPTKVLSNGTTVLSAIKYGDNTYYCSQTLAALVTLFNA
jgi:hypothetical protein